jgi:hypothetical protein
MKAVCLVAALGVASYGCTETTELIAAPPVCVAPGPIVHLGGTENSTCAGAVAAVGGRYALCTCSDLTLTGSLSVNPPKDMRGPATTPGAPPPPPSFLAAVGTDGSASISGFAHVRGSLVAAGVGGVLLANTGMVSGNVRSGGGLRTLAKMPFLVAGDAFVNGNVDGPFAIQGSIHLPSTSAIAPDVQGGSVMQEPVSVSPPCGCANGPAFDIGAAVAERKTKNANASLGFADTQLASESNTETIDWPCGEYYLSEIATDQNAALEFRVHGHVGIFVAGDVRLGNNLHVTFDPGADLDLVVAGSFFMTGRVFGSPATPALTRLWVASTTVSLPDLVQFGAAVYAPAAVFSAGVGMTFSGTLFVDTLSVAGDVRITYDPTAIQAGQSCGVAAPAPVE